jgi:hypothetical protein
MREQRRTSLTLSVATPTFDEDGAFPPIGGNIVACEPLRGLGVLFSVDPSRCADARTRTSLLGTVALCLGASATDVARADDTIRRPGDHPHYSVELEPHALVSWADQWSGTGLGLGARVSTNLTDDGFVKTINNSVAIGLGLDWAHYAGTGCYYDPRFPGNCCGYYPSADFLRFPVVMQWNFYVAHRWSVFAEPGLYVYHGDYGAPNYPCNAPGPPPCGGPPNNPCNAPGLPPCAFPRSDTGVGPALWVGGRYHFTDTVALTMRLGYPELLTFGVSFLP